MLAGIAPSTDDLVGDTTSPQCLTALISNVYSYCLLFWCFALQPVIVNLTRGHRESSVKDLFNVLDTLDSTYLMIPEVPHSHVGLRNRLSSNKKLLSTPLEQTAWMIEKVDLFSKVTFQ